MVDGRVEELRSDADFIELIKGQSSKLVFSNSALAGAAVEDLSGNINRVRRIRLQFKGGKERSFVVKHVPAHGRLERYPEIVFPESRLDFEVLWFGLAERLVGASTGVKTPHVLHFDKRKRLMIMEDLMPRCSLGDFLRQQENAAGRLLVKLGQFLGRIHGNFRGPEIINPSAALNRPFVFTLPLVQPEKMRSIWQETESLRTSQECCSWRITLQERIELQEQYLSGPAQQVLPVISKLERAFKQGRRNVLTHGDLHTESVLVLADDRLGVVDAELCDYGCPGFDLGMFCAHLWANRLVSGVKTKEIQREVECFMAGYANEFFDIGQASKEELWDLYESSVAHCGAEILRRLLGAAEFGFALSRDQFEELLEDASRFLLASKEWSEELLKQG